MRILLVEDDEVLTKILLESLKSRRYTVDRAADGRSGWEYATSTEYDLLLVDVGLPGLDGISLCQRLRSSGNSTPILLMTARDAREDRIRGLDAGADDYLVKPLDIEELHARLRALLRREKVIPTSVLEAGKLRLDPGRGQVTYDDRPVKLTPKEYTLLEIFLRNPSRLFSRASLVEHLWTFDDPPLEESVKAHVKGLRQKLKPLGLAGTIENVYGMGYRFTPPSERSEPKESGFDRAMGELWERYRGTMEQRLGVLQKAVREGSRSPETRSEARQAAHKLAGVLGMFGREEGTEIARAIEALLETGNGNLTELPSLVTRLSRILHLNVENVPRGETGETGRPKILVVGSDLPPLDPDLLDRHSCTDGEAARAWLRENSPDIAAIGSNPETANLALIRELASRNPPVPSVVVMEREDIGERLAIARAGGRKILVKPVTAGRIQEVVEGLLQNRLQESIKILAVDDDPVILATLPVLLNPWGIQVIGLENSLDFWERLSIVSPDLLLLDVEMPGLTGIDLCRTVRSDPRWQDLPILFLTASRDPDTIQQIFSIGGDDYLTKPVIGAELLHRVTARLERARLPRLLATREPITGLPNRTTAEREINARIEEARARGQKLSLVVISLVDLDRVPWQYGYGEGDRVLQYWGNFFKSRFLATEVVSYGGNGEFTIALPGLTKTEASDYLESIFIEARRKIFTAPSGDRYQIEARWGTAEYPADGLTLQYLYRTARGGSVARSGDRRFP